MRRYFPCAGSRALHAPTRREFIYSLGASLGSVAFTSLLAAEEKKNSLAPRPPHLPAKAKNVIFLMMEGGPSHIDTFDPKPLLAKMHLKEFVREGKQKSAMESGNGVHPHEKGSRPRSVAEIAGGLPARRYFGGRPNTPIV